MKYEVHPALASFPEQPEHELARLALDVKKNGLVNPVVLCDGQVLDGRARLVACERAKVKPTFFTYEGDDPVAFVVAANAGRQMTPGQRALAAARTARAWKAGRKVSGGTSEVSADTSGDASDRAARAFGVSRMTVFRAERVLGDEAIARDVEAGRLRVNEALRRLSPVERQVRKGREEDEIVAMARTVSRLKKKAVEFRDELRDACTNADARKLLESTLQDLATEFFNIAEGKVEEEGAAAL